MPSPKLHWIDCFFILLKRDSMYVDRQSLDCLWWLQFELPYYSDRQQPKELTYVNTRARLMEKRLCPQRTCLLSVSGRSVATRPRKQNSVIGTYCHIPRACNYWTERDGSRQKTWVGKDEASEDIADGLHESFLQQNRNPKWTAYGTGYVSVMLVPQRKGQPWNISYVTQTRKPCLEREILHKNGLSLWTWFFMNCDMRGKTGQKVKASRYQRRDVQLFPVLTAPCCYVSK